MNNQFYDIYEPYFEPFWLNKVVIGSLALLVFLLITGLCLLWYRRKSRQVPVLLTPVQEVYRRLKQLEEALNSGDIPSKQFYTILTESLKYYLEKECRYDVLYKTDDEMIRFFKQSPLSSYAHQGSLLFERAAAAKFAAAMIVPLLMAEDLKWLKHVIQETERARQSDHQRAVR
jgi:hypothetical protein